VVPEAIPASGDLFDRLPPPISRVRFHFALLCSFLFGIYLPVLIGLGVTQGMEAIAGLQFVPILLVAVLFIERRHTVKQTAALLGITSAEASRIIRTPTWRTSVWGRDPAVKLIRRELPVSGEDLVQSPVTPTVPMESDDRPTMS